MNEVPPNFPQLVEYYQGLGETVLLNDYFSWTVITPLEGTLSVDVVIDRLGYPSSALELGPQHGRMAREDRDLFLVQLGASVATFDYGIPMPWLLLRSAFKEESVRQWTFGWDIEANKQLTVTYPGASGVCHFPTDDDDDEWRQALGPLRQYEQVLAYVYEEQEKGLDDPTYEQADYLAQGTCFAIIEAESGIRFTADIFDSPTGVLRLRPEDASW
ncbi:hypothetical protein ACIBHX_50495 [Nonomuraea sp. NPDC050536]|uniref:hypothetical protein n=1 Tax=Nonomuraea sp. NPDC050536 TaxID=3364366 RepID=UPI0037CC436A